MKKSVDEVLDEYPAINHGLPLCQCNAGLEPILTKTSIGVQCIQCKSGVWQRWNEQDNLGSLNLLSNVMNSRDELAEFERQIAAEDDELKRCDIIDAMVRKTGLNASTRSRCIHGLYLHLFVNGFRREAFIIKNSGLL